MHSSKAQPADKNASKQRASQELPPPNFFENNFRGNLESVRQTPAETRLAHRLRLAILEGNSSDVRVNRKLQSVAKRVEREGMSVTEMKRIVKEFDATKNSCNRELLELRYQRKILVVCCVCTDQIAKVKQKLLRMLKVHNGGFMYVLNTFYGCAIIEAIIPENIACAFDLLESVISQDAVDCAANSVEIVDYETGAVQFKCHPRQLLDVLSAVKEKGYKVIYTEYRFRPKQKVRIPSNELQPYEGFLKRLKKLDGVKEVFDNVQRNTS